MLQWDCENTFFVLLHAFAISVLSITCINRSISILQKTRDYDQTIGRTMWHDGINQNQLTAIILGKPYVHVNSRWIRSLENVMRIKTQHGITFLSYLAVSFQLVVIFCLKYSGIFLIWSWDMCRYFHCNALYCSTITDTFKINQWHLFEGQIPKTDLDNFSSGKLEMLCNTWKIL